VQITFSHQNCPFACGDLDPHLNNTWLLGPTRVHDPNGISVSLAVFAGLMIATDQPTDRHASGSATIGGIYIAVRYSLIISYAIL